MATLLKPKITANKIVSDFTIHQSSLAGCGQQNIGTMQEKIKMGIDTIVSNLDICSAYGFGSFFRGESFNDIDILLTTEIALEKLPDLHRAICSKMSDLSLAINCRIDFTLLTLDEFSTEPLRDHAELVKLTWTTK